VEEPGKNQQTSQETIINLACKSLAQGPFFGPTPSKYYPFFCQCYAVSFVHQHLK